MRVHLAIITASLSFLALPATAYAESRTKPADAAAAPVQLSEKAQHALEILREMHAPEASIAETERYAHQRGPLAMHARDSLEFGYGHNWDNDDSLSRREKHLILIAALIATERGHELEAHLKLALSNGVKVEDFEPMLALLTPFLGLPVASNAAGKMHCLMVSDAERPAWCPPATPPTAAESKN